MESSPQPGRAGVLVLLAVVWLALVAVAVRFDAAFDLPRGGRALTLAALLAPLAGVWRYRPGAPRWPSRAVGGSALVACALLALSLAFVPASGARVRRLLAPWSQADATPVTHRVVTPTGDLTVNRGEGVTLVAYLDRTADGDLPRDAELTLTPPTGPATVVPLTSDDAATFSHTLGRVETGFRYRFRVGPVAGESHAVRVVEPTELLPTTALILTPPDYAKLALPPQRLAGPPTAARTLQHSHATLELRLNRRPERLTATWTPTGGTAVELPLTFAADGPNARLDWAVAASGRLTLRLDADGPPLWDLAVTADIDRPPACESLLGWAAGRREARPADRLPIDARFRDDAGIDSVVLEFTRNADATVQMIPLALPGLGTRLVEGVVLVPFPPGIVVGDVLRVRVVATDNRRDASRGLTPQRTTVPADGWVEFAITATARPLDEQAVVAHHDELSAGVARADRHLAEALADLDAVRGAPAAGLTPDQRVRLARAADELATLDAVAATLTRNLRDGDAYGPLRPAVAGVNAGGAVARSALTELLGRTELPPAALRETLDGVHGTLTAAKTGLAVAPAAVADGTQRRLAALQLHALAAEVRALDAARPPAELRARLDAVNAQLSGLASTSEPLRRGAAAHADANLRAFAAEVQALARDWRSLDAAATETANALRQQRLATVATRLTTLAAAVEAARGTVADAARACGLPTPPEGTLAGAARDLTAGRGLDALTALEKVAGELDKVAQRFDEARLARREPRDAVRQLAQIQADLARQSADGPATAASLAKLLAVQQTLNDLADAVAAPSVPLESVRAALAGVRDLPVSADRRAAYDRACSALSAWADATPTLAARRAASRTAAEALRREFEALSRGPAGGVAAGVAGLRGRVAGLDSAGEPGVRRRLARLGRTLDDLEAEARLGLAGDLAAAWAAARREWDGLADALQGRTPPAELAARIALRQRLLNESPGPSPADSQREITRQLAELPGLGAAPLLSVALDRSRDLEAAWRQPSPPPAALADALASARAVAARLHGDETAAARFERVRQSWAAPTGFQKPSPAEASADAARQVQRTLDELDATRAGPALPQKWKAIEALKRFRAAEPDRQAAFRAVADALAQLAAAAHAAPDAGRTLGVAGPEPRNEADARVELSAGGLWPEASHAATLRGLAVTARTLAKDASEGMTQTARWPTPLPPDDYGRLADALALQSPGHPAIALLRDGAGTRALATPGLPPAVAAELGALSENPAVGLTRQVARLAALQTRLGELAARATSLTPRLDEDSPASRLPRLLAAAHTCGRVAIGHSAAGRADATALARREALTALRVASFWADRVQAQGNPADSADVAVGQATASAERGLGAARTSPDAKRLGELAEALDGVAVALVPGRVGPPQRGVGSRH